MAFRNYDYTGPSNGASGSLGGSGLNYEYAQMDQSNELRRRYGTDDPTIIQGIQAQQASQAQQVQAQQNEYLKQQDASAQTDELGRRNRLGLGTLSSMLLDNESTLHRYEYDTGQKDASGNSITQTPQQMGWTPQISMGDAVNNPDGTVTQTAPSDLPPAPLASHGLGIRMMIPGMQAKMDALSPNNSRTLTQDEFDHRQQALTNGRLTVAQAESDARAARDAANNGVKVVLKQADVQSHDLTNTGKGNSIANDMGTSAGLGMRAMLGRAKQPTGGIAPTGIQAGGYGGSTLGSQGAGSSLSGDPDYAAFRASALKKNPAFTEDQIRDVYLKHKKAVQ